MTAGGERGGAGRSQGRRETEEVRSGEREGGAWKGREKGPLFSPASFFTSQAGGTGREAEPAGEAAGWGRRWNWPVGGRVLWWVPPRFVHAPENVGGLVPFAPDTLWFD